MDINSISNKIWQRWASENIEKGPPFGNNLYRSRWNKNVANEAKRGRSRLMFEDWLMKQGCYLEVSNGKAIIKGFDEDNLVMLVLRWV
jgi:hypothetical protein